MKKYLLILSFVISSLNVFSQIWYEANFTQAYPTQDRTLQNVMLNQQNGWGQTPPVNRPYCLQIVVDSVAAGIYSAKFVSKKDDTLVGGKHRSEIGLFSNSLLGKLTQWYCFGLQHPSWFTETVKREGDFQIADSINRPVVTLERKNGVYRLVNEYNPDATTAKQRIYIAGLDTPGHVSTWVLYLKPAINSTGRVQLYRDGNLVTLTGGVNQNGVPLDSPTVSTIYGANCNAINLGSSLYAVTWMYPKCGIYWYGVDDGPDEPTQVDLNITRIAFGGINSTIQDFVPLIPGTYIRTRKKPAARYSLP